MILWKIKKFKNKNLQKKKISVCPFISSVNIVTINIYNSVKQFLGQNEFNSVFFMTDFSSKNEVNELFRSYEVESLEVELNSNFDFLRLLQDECSKLIYLFSNFKLDTKMIANIAEEASTMPDSTLYFTTKCI